jgi:hypothetical protein
MWHETDGANPVCDGGLIQGVYGSFIPNQTWYLFSMFSLLAPNFIKHKYEQVLLP